MPPGTSTLAVTPVSVRSADITAVAASAAALLALQHIAATDHRAEAGGDGDDPAAPGE